MSDEIPDHYRTLLKDWHRIVLPADANPHAIAVKCHIPPGSYFATAGALWLETSAYVDAVKPFLAAEAIASHAPVAQDEAQDHLEPAGLGNDGD